MSNIENKIRRAEIYVTQARSRYEQCGEQITEDIDSGFKNDAANIFGDSFEEYTKIFNALRDF